ncbi:hypothetical protein MTX26_14335 [Bradyrhizobium sp. ISRA443]|uniref:hypothetical protein n=1 Tax=unclassified Bradyrhizobium TaxID=2631580 RepID=UPI0024783839|nr:MULTISPECIES: hypothetical protein [unclassified Bradyrhizobium]WGR91611.1 hypothetical protein MTX20_24855 [Bradyrhizobium sp. ISRA435]WGS01916.1 hypothetical protein MTX23_14345 [Bradyrhizobium sp. ISRA436]WGS08802.1 hypothetical protein MTX18_14335 [Bradyrhizobium sp. ISRA437]WGS15690.1 hypothetical protein MTX26_14335 [Bradyrhizobium sp. ISRA443]
MRTITTMGLFLTVLAVSMAAADARGGGHGFGHGGRHVHGVHGGGASGAGAFAADKRHADDPYIKAASDEEDRLLNSKLKSICRGC